MQEIIKQILDICKHNREGSFSTQKKRRDTLVRAGRILTEKFPKLRLGNLKQKHVNYILQEWKNHKSIKTEVAHIRWLLRKIRKEHLLPGDNASLGIGRRFTVARENNSRQKKEVDVQKKIEEVGRFDERVGLALELCIKFGLRMKEASIFRPHENIKDEYIEVVYGTKGGRKRAVEIQTDEQMMFLQMLKNRIPRGRSLVPSGWAFKQFKNRFYYVCGKCGIKRKYRITVHGLRHTYACERYMELTSSTPPVLQDRPQRIKDKEKDLEARAIIASELGHGRISVTSAYLGGRR